MIDIRQTEEYANYLKKEGWIVERIENINHFIKKLPLIGSILKLQRPEILRYKDIEILSKKYRVFQIIIEPKTIADGQWLMTKGYQLSKSPYLPSKTLQIDLTQALIFNKETRRCIKIGDRVKIRICSTLSDLRKFHNAWKNSVKFTRFVPSYQSLINLHNSFSLNNPIILTSHNPTTLKLRRTGIFGGAIFVRSQDIAYYWQAFTNKEGRASLSQYSLVYQGILWAKRMGCRVFDFEGIYDERFPNKSWSGFTHFKKSFGGREVSYPGCYTKFRFPYW